MIGVELARQVRRTRTYIWLGTMAVLPLVLSAALSLGVGPGRHMTGEGFIALATQSGLNMAVVSLQHAAVLFLPVAVAVFAGSAVAEDASWGTLRYLLVRPVSRTRFLLGKLMAVAALVLVAVAFVAVASIVGGLIAFGGGALQTPDGESMGRAVTLGRIMLAIAYLGWGMAGVAGLAFFVSVTARSPLNGAAAGFGSVVVSQLLDSFGALGDVRNLLPTHHWSAWEDLFLRPIPAADLVAGTVTQAVYLGVFVALAWWRFRRMDIVT